MVRSTWFEVALFLGVSGGLCAALGGCGSVVQVTGSGGGGAAAGAGGETSAPPGGGGATATPPDGGAGATSTGGTGSGATSTGGTGGVDDGACPPGLPPFAGQLCPLFDEPCVVAVDENLGEGFGGNDGPAVAVGPDCVPHVVFAASTPQFKGIYADRKGPAQWDEAVLPGTTALAGHVIDGKGTASLVSYDGAMQMTLWQREPDGPWDNVSFLASDAWFNSTAVAVDDDDGLHMAWVDGDQHLHYGHPTGAGLSETFWSVDPLVAAGTCQVAVTPEGLPHIVFWATSPTGWEARYMAPNELDEPIAELGSASLEPPAAQMRLGLSADGLPMVLMVKPMGDPPLPSLQLARRLPGGGWKFTVIEHPVAPQKECSGPSGNGQVCTTVSEAQMFALGVVVSRGGDARFLYSVQRHEATQVMSCSAPPDVVCNWLPVTSKSVGQIHFAFLGQDDETVLGAPLADGLAYAGNAVLDRWGRIHLAVYDATDPDRPARYLRVGPGL